MEKATAIVLTLDRDADVLYIQFGETQSEQVNDESPNGDIVRYSKVTGEPSGAIIPRFSQRAANADVKILWKQAQIV